MHPCDEWLCCFWRRRCRVTAGSIATLPYEALHAPAPKHASRKSSGPRLVFVLSCPSSARTEHRAFCKAALHCESCDVAELVALCPTDAAETGVPLKKYSPGVRFAPGNKNIFPKGNKIGAANRFAPGNKIGAATRFSTERRPAFNRAKTYRGDLIVKYVPGEPRGTYTCECGRTVRTDCWRKHVDRWHREGQTKCPV